MQGCNQKLPLCNCVDWKKDDLVLQVNHLMTHFEFSRFELEYNTLELEENRRRLQETVQGNLYGLMARETNIEFLPYDRLTGALGAAAFVVRRCLLD